jgi:hypothetical protein
MYVLKFSIQHGLAIYYIATLPGSKFSHSNSVPGEQTYLHANTSKRDQLISLDLQFTVRVKEKRNDASSSESSSSLTVS